MHNTFFWIGIAVLVGIFIIAAVIRKRTAKRKGYDPSDIYPMW